MTITRPSAGPISAAGAYGWRRLPNEPPTRHNGIDFVGAYGSFIRAVKPGVVIVSAPNGTYNRYGNLIVIKHDDPSEAPYSLYAHLSERKVSKGRRVRAGQIIGKMGNLAATAAEPSKMVRTHLHFELLQRFPAPPDVDRIDPTPYLVPEESPFTYTSPALYSQTSPLLYENVSPLAGLGVISGAGSQFGGALVVGGIAFLIYKLTNQQRAA